MKRIIETESGINEIMSLVEDGNCFIKGKGEIVIKEVVFCDISFTLTWYWFKNEISWLRGNGIERL